MTRKKYRIERRRHERVRLRAGAVAFNGTTFGEVIDIGRGGLALRTMAPGGSTAPEELSVLTADGNFFWDNIVCKTVSDADTSREEGERYVKKMRRRGVRFEELTPEQQAQLEQFISRQKGKS